MYSTKSKTLILEVSETIHGSFQDETISAQLEVDYTNRNLHYACFRYFYNKDIM